MKRTRIMRVATALALASAASLLVGCGKSSAPIAPIAGGITPGSVMPGFPGYTGMAGACVPISQQIPFMAAGAYMDSASIVAGYLPGGSTAGIVQVGTGGGGGMYQRYGTAVDGILSMNIIPASMGYGGYGYNYGGYGSAGSNQVNISGTIMIAPATQQDIYYQMGMTGASFGFGSGYTSGYTPGYPGYPTFGSIPMGNPYSAGQLCVSSVAINSGHSGYQLYSATTYIYLNGSSHGYVLAL